MVLFDGVRVLDVEIVAAPPLSPRSARAMQAGFPRGPCASRRPTSRCTVLEADRLRHRIGLLALGHAMLPEPCLLGRASLLEEQQVGEDGGVVQRLLEALARGMAIILGLDDGDRDAQLLVEDVIGEFLLLIPTGDGPADDVGLGSSVTSRRIWLTGSRPACLMLDAIYRSQMSVSLRSRLPPLGISSPRSHSTALYERTRSASSAESSALSRLQRATETASDPSAQSRAKRSA